MISLSEKNKKYFIKLLMSSFFIYFLAVLLTFIISAYATVNKNRYSPYMLNIVASCKKYSFSRDYNLANPFDFYLNTDYWLTDFRLSKDALKDQSCVKAINENILFARNKISFFGQDGEVVLIVLSE